MNNSSIFELNDHGYITKWLVSGVETAPFNQPSPQTPVKNQLEFEKYLRSKLADDLQQDPPAQICLGKPGPGGSPWCYYYNHGNWMIDIPATCPLPTKVELCAVTELLCAQDTEIPAVLWTFAAIDLWLNGVHLCRVGKPVYKPMHKEAIRLPLRKGINRIFIRMQNMGVRDTRNLFGIQFPDRPTGLQVTLPEGGDLQKVVALDCWLSDIGCCKGRLTFSGPPPIPVTTAAAGGSFVLQDTDEFSITPDMQKITITGTVAGQKLVRELEISENMGPVYNNQPPPAGDYCEIYERLAETRGNRRGSGLSFYTFHVLARIAVGKQEAEDEQRILSDLELIDKRIDCSDFIAAGILRLVKKYPQNPRITAEVRRVMLNYRYWMDEDGEDGMCFWSENHALMFYVTQLIAGELYPEDLFVRSGRTGKQQHTLGCQRVEQWLSDIEKDGFEEFISAAYMCVTFGALLMVIDFAPQALSARAAILTDVLLRQLCTHTFHGVVIGPQGRVYGDVITPYSQGVQAMIHMIDQSTPIGENMWIASMATTNYCVPDGLTELMRTPAEYGYIMGNARIDLKKTEHYLMTSVRSPRDAKDTLNWNNISFDDDADRDSYAYVKSLNERYHGTTKFEAGIFGYQQHVWYAALDSECVVLANHPGTTGLKGEMRPGYWYGNGLMPAVRQSGNLIGVIHQITEEHPIGFTHLYWPTAKFDEVVQCDGWLFGRKGSGYLAVWCSRPMEPYNNSLFDCEYRTNGGEIAYLCRCSDVATDGSMVSFKANCQALAPVMDTKSMTLTAKDYSLTFKKEVNKTQYI